MTRILFAVDGGPGGCLGQSHLAAVVDLCSEEASLKTPCLDFVR